jgi:hypothetical protein
VEPCPLESPEPASGWLRSAAAVPEEEPRAPERPVAGRDTGTDISASARGLRAQREGPQGVQGGPPAAGASSVRAALAAPPARVFSEGKDQ